MLLCLLRHFAPSLLRGNSISDRCLSSTERFAWTAAFERSVRQGRDRTVRASKGKLMNDDRAAVSLFDFARCGLICPNRLWICAVF